VRGIPPRYPSSELAEYGREERPEILHILLDRKEEHHQTVILPKGKTEACSEEGARTGARTKEGDPCMFLCFDMFFESVSA